MLHHLSLPVSNLERSASFFDSTLSSLGYRRIWRAQDAIGYTLEAVVTTPEEVPK